MPNLSAWASPTNAESATSIGDLITRKPTTITIVRAGSAIASQVVRLETLASQRAVVGEGGLTFMCDAMALGYYNHPTVANTNIQAGDRFRVGSVDYEVVLKMPAHTDCCQVWLKVRA